MSDDGQAAVGLLLHKVADKSDESALHADLPGAPPGTWPLAAVVHIGEPPARTAISTSLVQRGVDEGWVETHPGDPVHRPGGPPSDPWRVTHTFLHRKQMTVAGVPYRVVRQPDKYADHGDDTTPVTDEAYAAGATRVDHFYGLERVDR